MAQEENGTVVRRKQQKSLDHRCENRTVVRMPLRNLVTDFIRQMAKGAPPADRAEARELLAKLNAPETEYAAPRRAKKGGRRGCR